MKRSQINRVLREMEAELAVYRIALPPFCRFSPEEWRLKGHEYDGVRRNKLGWDVTDFGMGDFGRFGLTQVTMRSGDPAAHGRSGQIYTEKVIYLREGQATPAHYHGKKMEDLVNRGGGNLRIHVCRVRPDGSTDESAGVRVCADGRYIRTDPGGRLTLKPGMSLSIEPFVCHELMLEPFTGPGLIGEISQRNDDGADNYFERGVPIGPVRIEEDELPYRLLCGEYPPAK